MLKRYNKLVYLFVRPNMCVLNIDINAFSTPGHTDLFTITTQYKQNPKAKKKKRNYWVASYYLKTKHRSSHMIYGFGIFETSLLFNLAIVKFLYKEYKKYD